MSRPSKLTPAVQEAVVQAIQTGAPRDAAAQHAGIGARTLYDWLRRAEESEAQIEEWESLDRRALLKVARTRSVRLRPRETKPQIIAHLSEPDAPYRALRDAVRQADGTWEVGLLARIMKVAPSDWRAAAWLLERRRPGSYGRRQAVEMSGPDREPVKIEHRLATIEEARQVWALLKQTGILDDPDETPGEELEVDEAEAGEGADADEPQAAPPKLPVPPAHGARPARPAVPLGSGGFPAAARRP